MVDEEASIYPSDSESISEQAGSEISPSCIKYNIEPHNSRSQGDLIHSVS